ncbi:formate dehydrogenase accessory sulfurtransferase FdhD [Virgibacillus ndiopensis]|uniref:formate dehydrogenase accessory sulfurtransferase FdhD n=1 Tax=Virgibacillus ndiopensis TaxID=2004408 RepID=UPI000C07442B|nr:formate dehydrogenase accessory sulfurtransferase FdhD [Virgibacillus ndiopensis]
MNDTTQYGWEIIRFDGDSFSKEKEEIATEFPLTIMLNGEEFATVVCTPTDIEELLIGILASEGVIRYTDEINTLHVDKQLGFAYVEIDKPLTEVQHEHSKRFIGSCCGKSRQFYFKSDVKTAKTIASRLSITVDQCYDLMKQLQIQSEQFQRTGGVHNTALCTPNKIFSIRTDIGRHNALDKIYGQILQDKIPLHDKLIAFSGRISSEVLLKISKIGVGILISKSAPTDLALKLANDLGITTIGFVRGNKMNVYTHPYRIFEVN